MNGLGREWRGGPHSQRAREVVSERRDSIRSALGRFDDLVAEVSAASPPPVITHGEPHGGNLIRSERGRRSLVDWDTVGLAPRERDLWMLDDGTPDALAPYVAATGSEISRATLALYRLMWSLNDVAAFVARLRSKHEDDADSRHALGALRETLEVLA